MKKLLAIFLLLILSLQMTCTVLGAGEEYNRPNDEALVLKYLSEEENLKWKYYETEKAEVFGNAKINTDHEGYRGKGCVALSYWSPGLTVPGIKFTVNAPVKGPQEFLIGYDNGHDFAQSANLIINDTDISKIYFPTVEKDNWKAYGIIKINVNLKLGANTIVLTYDDTDAPSSFNVDFIALTKGDTWDKEALSIKLKIGDKTIIKNTLAGEIPVEGDVAPVIKDGRTFVPLRGVLEMMDTIIFWDEGKRTVEIRGEDKKIDLPIGRIGATVNGEITLLDAAPFIEEGRTMVPLRFISETLGYKVDWNGDTREVTINIK